ncbi:MAG: porin family protein [Epsilonproteobacteria bacterium]|nr:porin family protein [Campylobacterota bacterium]
MRLKKLLENISLVALLAVSATSVSANDDFTFNTKSLIGFEGGYSTFNVDNNYNAIFPINGIDATESYDSGHLGLKIGAEGDDFRVFLSARNFFIGSDYDYFVTLGAEIDYKFNFSKVANFYIGANGGYLFSKFQADNETWNRKIDGFYYGGQLGFNFHMSPKYDLEVGARIMDTDASNDTGAIKYTLDYIAEGYVSFIIKFDMD